MKIAETGQQFMELARLLVEVEDEMELLKEAMLKAQESYAAQTAGRP